MDDVDFWKAVVQALVSKDCQTGWSEPDTAVRLNLNLIRYQQDFLRLHRQLDRIPQLGAALTESLFDSAQHDGFVWRQVRPYCLDGAGPVFFGQRGQPVNPTEKAVVHAKYGSACDESKHEHQHAPRRPHVSLSTPNEESKSE